MFSTTGARPSPEGTVNARTECAGEPASYSARAEWSGAAIAALAALLLQGALFLDPDYPINLSGDHIFLLTQARLMAEGQGFWSSSLLGFPFTHDTRYFPGFELLPKAVLWVIAQFAPSPFTAAKVFFGVGIAAMAAGAYWCLRKLSIPPWLACVGAVCFVVTPFFAVRIANHDYIALYVAAAFGATLALLIISSRDPEEMLSVLRSRFGLVALIVIATCGIYHWFFSMLFIGVAALGVSFSRPSVLPMLVFAVTASMTAAVLVIGGFGPGLTAAMSEDLPLRFPFEQLYHGLSISDAILLLPQQLGVRLEGIPSYLDVRSTTLVGEGAGEWPGIVLTLTILSAPLILLGRLVAQTSPSWIEQRIGIAAVLIVIGILFAHRGGVGFLFNELVSPAIRAQNRIMPSLTFFAIFILCASSQSLFSSPRRLVRIAALGMPVLILLSAMPASGALTRAQARTIANPETRIQMQSWAALTAAKTQRGLSAVLQLPAARWPEIPPRNGFEFYEHQYGVIFDAPGSKTRWSYGAAAKQPGFNEWLAGMDAVKDPSGLLARARQSGFDAIVIEKRAYTAQELTGFLDLWRASLPGLCRVYEDDRRVLLDIGRMPECRV
ncbi:MAG: hypothetical protein QOD74_1201 [Variibacter sp.]|nr:hypothetical protein [Variibacter sp.]